MTDAHVMVVAGKGGVGSSTAAAALALVAARDGASVIIISVDGRPGLGPLLGGRPLDGIDRILQTVGTGSSKGVIRGRTIPPQAAFADYLELKGINTMLRKAASAASLDSIAAATPGLEHLLVLGKIKELERERAADLIIVDAPPAGHAAAFLRSAAALQKVVTSGPVRTQADEIAEMLADRTRCQGLLVTVPEETPVNELVELAYDIEEELGLTLAPIIVNACWPDRDGLALTPVAAAKQQNIKLSAANKAALDGSSEFGRVRLDIQRRQLARLDEQLALPRIMLPRLATARLGPAELETIADALGVEPTLAVTG
ncbi:MAG: ArsA-related P-loop ATPase [Ilumatobacteraceae bacterium]